jgi:hypothetical protein
MANKNSIPPGAFVGPGYSGFGGSAGYFGGGLGGVSGGGGGGEPSTEPWRPAPDTHHDDRIYDDIRERLTRSLDIDASEIEVSVEAGVVTLEGRVEERATKHSAGEIAERVPGVHRVRNNLHVGEPLLDRLRDKLAGRD